MHITVLYFAQAREHAGRASQDLELPEGSRVAEALEAIQKHHPRLVELWPHLAFAVDGTLSDETAALKPGAELALLPPVSGG